MKLYWAHITDCDKWQHW